MKMIIRGSVIGVFVGLGISIIMSYIFASGKYYPMSPHSMSGEYFYSQLSETTTFIIALASWALIGNGFNLASQVFRHEQWSNLKMTIIHLFIVIAFFFPLSVLSGWYPLTLKAFLSFVTLFIIIYTVIWIIMYFINHRRIKEINRQLNS